MNVREAAIERGLAELVGDDAPPDLTFTVLREVRRRQAKPERPSHRHAFWLGTAIATAAAVTIWLIASVPVVDVAVELRVLAGTVTWESPRARWTGSQGQQVLIAPRVGDAVRTHETPGQLELVRFGRLDLAPYSHLEIEAVDMKGFAMGFGTASITIGVLAGAVQYFGYDGDGSAQPGDTVELRAAPLSASIATAKEQELTAELAEARSRIAELESSRRQAVADRAGAEGSGESVPDEPDYPTIPVASRWAAMAEKIDWSSVGPPSVELARLYAERAERLANGEEKDPEVEGAIQEIDGKLMQLSGPILEFEVPGMSPNLVVRHPAVAANWMNSMLESSGLSLDDDQRRQIEDLTSRLTKEDELRIASYGDDSPEIAKFYEEVTLRERFFEQSRQILSDDQAAVLWVDDGGRSNINVLSTDFAWGDWTEPVVVADRRELARATANRFASRMELAGAEREALDRLVSGWADAYPDALWNRPFDRLDELGYHSTAHLRAATERHLALVRSIQSNVRLTAEQRRALLRMSEVYVPYRAR